MISFQYIRRIFIKTVTLIYFELRNSISLVPEPGRRATLSQAVIPRQAQEVTFLQFRNSKLLNKNTAFLSNIQTQFFNNNILIHSYHIVKQ